MLGRDIVLSLSVRKKETVNSLFCPLFSEFYRKIRLYFSKNLRLALKFSNPARVKIGGIFWRENHHFCKSLLHNHLQLRHTLSPLERAGDGFPRRPYCSATGPLLLCNERPVAT